MSNKPKDDGGPAFPVADLSKTQCPGMTLRDYFATQAPIDLSDARRICGFSEGASMLVDSQRATLWAVLSMTRYEYADAMLAEKSKP
jgi:hypothetical protein